MMIGETVSTGAQTSCYDCGKELELKVCSSMAGYYLGYFCDRDGPHSRETEYFKNKKDAETALSMYQGSGQLELDRRHL